jgi:hypothetical protein
VNHTEEEKRLILLDIIDEFCRFLQDFFEIKWQRLESDSYPYWEFTSLDKRDIIKIELINHYSTFTDKSITVIMGEIPEDIKEKWNQEKKMWFSIGSRSCSEHLNSLGEEFREFFKRYGIYYARP